VNLWVFNAPRVKWEYEKTYICSLDVSYMLIPSFIHALNFHHKINLPWNCLLDNSQRVWPCLQKVNAWNFVGIGLLQAGCPSSANSTKVLNGRFLQRDFLKIICQVNLGKPVASLIISVHSSLSWASSQDRVKVFHIHRVVLASPHPCILTAMAILQWVWSRSLNVPDALPVTKPAVS